MCQFIAVGDIPQDQTTLTRLNIPSLLEAKVIDDVVFDVADACFVRLPCHFHHLR